MNKPYCITREEGKLILETQFIEDDSTTDYSGSEDDSDETNTTNDSDGESEKSDSSAHSDCDPNYYWEEFIPVLEIFIQSQRH